MTAANKITIGRILLVPAFVVALLHYTGTGDEFYRWLAIGLFAIVAVGDGIDGWVARRFNQRTEMGALLDPLADKLLLVLGLVILTLDNRPRLNPIPIWLTATVVSRDVMLLLLLVLVNYLVGKGTVRPHFVGKVATVLQMACVLWILFKWPAQGVLIVAVVATFCTAVSGVIYLREGLEMLKVRPPAPPGGG